MSCFSGKCDLADHISGLGGWFDKDGNPVKFNEYNGALYSDEYLDFLAFKERTGGVMYQHQKIKVTDYNLEDIERLTDNNFKAIKHERVVADKRTKSGERKEVYYTYVYYDREYTSLKELNKRGVYIKIEIHFDTLLDLIPYYPYIVAMCACSDGKETVYLSKNSFAIEERDDLLSRGLYSTSWMHYTKELTEHLRDVTLRYFNPVDREHVEEIIFRPVEKDDKVIYLGKTSLPISTDFNVEWCWKDNKIKTHWTSPRVYNADEGLVEMSPEDYKAFLGDTMDVYYVEKREHKTYVK